MQDLKRKAGFNSVQVLALVLLAFLLLILKFSFRQTDKIVPGKKAYIHGQNKRGSSESQREDRELSVFRSSERSSGASLENGGFEEDLKFPWGTGLYSDYGIWWNSMNCQSSAELDSRNSRSGRYSLHIINLSPRQPHVFGNMSQRISIEPNRKYMISLWAKADNLASANAVNVPVDPGWFIRPIQLPRGTFDWTEFKGEFSLDTNYADIRILIEDTGEVWIDDLEVNLLN